MRTKLVTLGIFLSLLVLLMTCSMIEKTETQEKKKLGIYVYKFLDIKTYPTSINEEMFWGNESVELAKLKLDIEDDYDALKEDISKLNQIENGLSEDFDYAFLIRKENEVDTIYASLSQNLWTIKEKGEFLYYKDGDGEMKDFFQNYSSFFSDCW